MLTLMNRKNIKIGLVSLSLALMVLAGSVSAKGARKESGKASRGSQKKSQQAARASPAPKARRSPNVAKSRPKVSAPARPSSSRRSSSALKRASRPKAGKISKSPGRQSRRVTRSRRAAQRPKTASGARRLSRSPSGTRKSASASSSTVRQGSLRSGSRTSASRTARIGSPVSRTLSSVTTTGKVSRDSKVKVSRSSAKTARIGYSIGEKTSPVTTTSKVTRDSKPKTSVSRDETARISSSVSEKTSSVATTRRVSRSSKQKIDSNKVLSRNNRKVPRKSKKVIGKSRSQTRASRERKNVNLKVVRRISDASRTRKAVRGDRETTRGPKVLNRRTNRIVNNTRVVTDSDSPAYVNRTGHNRETTSSSSTTYREHPHATKRVHRHEHVYRDRHGRLCHRIVWPRYRFGVYYQFGRHSAFRYVYPYHHRRYLFVSLGGYWPIGYRYIRYYWYGYHPYRWYGYYPIAREVQGDTYNYYTYNYYDNDSAVPSESGEATYGAEPVDHTTFADVREKLAQQAAVEPEPETLADIYFKDAVEAFETGDYDIAADIFAKAFELAPDDIVLPFAYSQALFAGERYTEAAEVLRVALAKVTPEQEGVFYPRGLYTEDNILIEQIDRLAERAALYSFDADLQLLLGYQLLGIGEINEAVEPLRRASEDLENAASATVLLNLLEKIRANNSEDTDQ